MGIVQRVIAHMAALGSVGKIDQPGQGNEALGVFHLHLPGEDGAVRLIQFREPLRQGVQLIEAAAPVDEGP